MLHDNNAHDGGSWSDDRNEGGGVMKMLSMKMNRMMNMKMNRMMKMKMGIFKMITMTMKTTMLVNSMNDDGDTHDGDDVGDA